MRRRLQVRCGIQTSAPRITFRKDELPTCLTLVRSLVVSRAAKLLGHRLQGSLANFLSPVRWAGLFSACVPPVPVAGGVTQKRCAQPKVGLSFARADSGGPTETEVRAYEGTHWDRSPQGVGRRRGGRRNRRRAPRACQLPAKPRRPEVTRTLGETIPRAPLGCGERRRPRSAPGGEAGSGRRVRGGRAAQAFGKVEGALDRQRS